MPVGNIVVNPYDGVDWDSLADPLDTGRPPKSEFHNHPRGEMDTFADVIDLYSGEGDDGVGNQLDSDEKYTIFGVSPSGGSTAFWPWSDADRDPEDLDVIAFPAFEYRNHTSPETGHSNFLFTTSVGPSGDNKWGPTIDHVLNTESHLSVPSGGAQFNWAHITTWYSASEYSADLFADTIREFSLLAGLTGFEVLNSNQPDVGDDETVDLWDLVLDRVAPWRMVWGYGVDDPRDDYDIGGWVDRRWTSVLVTESEFDPSNQRESLKAAEQAYLRGRTLAHRRNGWDPDTEEPPTVPNITEIEVDTDVNTITITAEDYDEINWISSGEIVDTGETIEVEPDHAPYVRAQLLNSNSPDAETLTQPWGIDDGARKTVRDVSQKDVSFKQ